MGSVVPVLERWSERFAAGRIRDVALFRPKLGADERLASKVFKVGVTEQLAEATMSEWRVRPGSIGLSARSEGLAYATSERVFVANAGKVSHEWRWDDLFAVRVLPNLDGVVLARSPDPETVEVIAGELTRRSLANLRKRAIDWIKFEAAFAASRGELDSWLRDAGRRFDAKKQRS